MFSPFVVHLPTFRGHRIVRVRHRVGCTICILKPQGSFGTGCKSRHVTSRHVTSRHVTSRHVHDALAFLVACDGGSHTYAGLVVPLSAVTIISTPPPKPPPPTEDSVDMESAAGGNIPPPTTPRVPKSIVDEFKAAPPPTNPKSSAPPTKARATPPVDAAALSSESTSPEPPTSPEPTSPEPTTSEPPQLPQQQAEAGVLAEAAPAAAVAHEEGEHSIMERCVAGHNIRRLARPISAVSPTQYPPSRLYAVESGPPHPSLPVAVLSSCCSTPLSMLCTPVRPLFLHGLARAADTTRDGLPLYCADVSLDSD
jgi:hypothetical protein